MEDGATARNLLEAVEFLEHHPASRLEARRSRPNAKAVLFRRREKHVVFIHGDAKEGGDSKDTGC